MMTLPEVPHGTTRRRGRRYDSMREIDLILLEDAMLHDTVETTPIAVACRTGAMLVVLLAVVAVLAHSIVTGGRQVTAASNAASHEQSHTR
jgi:type IV secretory pathway TrbL component